MREVRCLRFVLRGLTKRRRIGKEDEQEQEQEKNEEKEMCEG